MNYKDPDQILYNSDGRGYGLSPASLQNLDLWDELENVTRGSLLINIYENMLERNGVEPKEYARKLLELVPHEDNQLLINQMLGQIRIIYWNLLNEDDRLKMASGLENTLWEAMMSEDDPAHKKTFFTAYRNIALTTQAIQNVYDIWNRELDIEGLNLSETDYISMASDLAVKIPGESDSIISSQLDRIQNEDRRRRFEFIAPALSNDPAVRDDFFESLKKEENRQTESWVLSALGYLNHPLRVQHSEKYIVPSLELLEEIQVTGDIFFPKRWLDVTLGNHSSGTAVQTVRDFLDERPDYNNQLKMKILQAADMMFRANEISMIHRR